MDGDDGRVGEGWKFERWSRWQASSAASFIDVEPLFSGLNWDGSSCKQYCHQSDFVELHLITFHYSFGILIEVLELMMLWIMGDCTPLSRFVPRVGLVASRQTFVHRCQTSDRQR
jgi:hypothetical protein